MATKKKNTKPPARRRRPSVRYRRRTPCASIGYIVESVLEVQIFDGCETSDQARAALIALANDEEVWSAVDTVQRVRTDMAKLTNSIRSRLKRRAGKRK